MSLFPLAKCTAHAWAWLQKQTYMLIFLVYEYVLRKKYIMIDNLK